MTRAEKLRKLALYIPDPTPILEIAEEVEAIEKRLVDLESNVSFLMGAVTALRMHNKTDERPPPRNPRPPRMVG